MSDNVPTQQSMDNLIQTISKGFNQLHEDSVQRENILQQHYQRELNIQDKKNIKWKIGATLAGILVVMMTFSFHKTINIFEEDMNNMSSDMALMSGYMKSMSSDISTMNGNIGIMAPQMTHMAGDMNSMSSHITAIDKNMGAMGQDMGQINNAMSPLMGSMQKFVPGNW